MFLCAIKSIAVSWFLIAVSERSTTMWAYWSSCVTVLTVRATLTDIYKHTVPQDKKRQLTKPPQLLIKPLIQGDRWQDVRTCVCVCETAVAVILVWRRPSQVLPPGLHWGRHSGHCIFLCMCACLDVRLSEGKPALSWVCVFLHLGFGGSVQVYVSCHAFVKASICSKSHTLPQSSWHGERQREFS